MTDPIADMLTDADPQCDCGEALARRYPGLEAET